METTTHPNDNTELEINNVTVDARTLAETAFKSIRRRRDGYSGDLYVSPTGDIYGERRQQNLVHVDELVDQEELFTGHRIPLKQDDDFFEIREIIIEQVADDLVDKHSETQTKTSAILSDDDIRSAVPEMDDPLAPSVGEIRDALEAVQHEASENPIYTADDDHLVYEDQTCYVLLDDDHEGLKDLLNDVGIADEDLREAVRYCHSEYGKSINYDWSASYPLVIAR